MLKPNLITLSSALALSLALSGCQSVVPPVEVADNITSVPSIDNQQSVVQQAIAIQQALANNDYASLTKDIHPTRGVRFSMYAYVRPEADKIFTRQQYAQYLKESNTRFTWGEKDGTGELLVTPLPNYLATWVQAASFTNTPISINTVKPTGNMINNVKDIYPQADVVDFYCKGSEEYSGMDWRVLRLVFDEYQGKRYLVAIIADQWTV